MHAFAIDSIFIYLFIYENGRIKHPGSIRTHIYTTVFIIGLLISNIIC